MICASHIAHCLQWLFIISRLSMQAITDALSAMKNVSPTAGSGVEVKMILR
jgi:hypothetical protein